LGAQFSTSQGKQKNFLQFFPPACSKKSRWSKIPCRARQSSFCRAEIILAVFASAAIIPRVMNTTTPSMRDLEQAIRNVPDFPKPGIQFKDITPVLANGRLFAKCINQLCGNFKAGDVDAVVGIDARGFIFAAAAALQLQCGFVPVRKQGKLPFTTYEQSYDLEYGSNTIAIHTDSIRHGSRVLLIDDLLATGGTAAAAAELLKKVGANILEITFFIELSFLNGRDKLKNFPVRSLVSY
jgi:adenine phosphoribosyltransferase